MAPHNMCLWCKGYLGLIIFKKLQTQKKLWEPYECNYFIRDIYIYKRTLHLERCVLSVPGREDD